jgi:hypothetical protein
MVKLLFVVLSEVSAGELTIAYEFASRLPVDKYDVVFLTPRKFGSYLESRGMKYLGLDQPTGAVKNREIIDNLMKSFGPDYMMISDVFTTEYAYSWSGINFAVMREYGVPILGVDEYEFLSAGYSMDYYGGFSKKLPPLVDCCDFVIRNCPINISRTNDGEKVKCFSLYGNKMVLSDKEKEEVRRTLGIDDDEKMVFYTTSTWEMLNIYRLSALGILVRWVPLMLQNYLKALNRKVTVIHVGVNPWKDFESEKVRYCYFPNLLPADFDKYLLSSDLFITLNVVSVTLSKAIFGGIPSIVFQNLKTLDFKKLSERVLQMPDWFRQMAEEVKIAFPFRASVLGWYKFLETVLKDNDYTGTYVEAPFFKVSEAVSGFEQCLFNDDFIRKLKTRQMNYVERVLALPTPDEIMCDIVKATHLKGGI